MPTDYYGRPTGSPSNNPEPNRGRGERSFKPPDFVGEVPAPPEPVVVRPRESAAPALPPPAPPPPIPIAGGSGFYNPTTAPFGMDMSAPGVQEQFWNNNQNLWFQNPALDWVNSQLPQFKAPWQGEAFVGDMLAGFGGGQHWNGKSGGMNSPKYRGQNNAQEAFNMQKQAMPGTLQPQFDAYYDRMKQKSMSDVNSQAAGRGVYGSNSALNNSIGAGIDVEAQRAKAGTDFSLADSANQRSWFDSLGNQGRNADLSGLGIFGANMESDKFDLDRMRTLSDIAFGMDDSRRQRVETGLETGFGAGEAYQGQLEGAYDAAGQAQDAREGRVGGLYDDVSGFSSDVMGYFAQNYDKILTMDEQTFTAEIEAMLGETADQRGWDQQQQDRMVRDAVMAFKAIKGKQAEGEAGIG